MKRQKRLWTAAAACAVLGAACRAVPGVRFAGLLFWCLTALLIVFAMLEQYKEHAWAKWGKRVLLALVCLGLVAFGYLESLVIRGAHTDGRAEDAQCVVILGAGVNGTTPSLMARIVPYMALRLTMLMFRYARKKRPPPPTTPVFLFC